MVLDTTCGWLSFASEIFFWLFLAIESRFFLSEAPFFEVEVCQELPNKLPSMFESDIMTNATSNIQAQESKSGVRGLVSDLAGLV